MTDGDRRKATVTLICSLLSLLAMAWLGAFAVQEGSPAELHGREIAVREDLLRRVTRIEQLVNRMVQERIR